MAQITINDLTVGFRGPSLLDGVSCRIEPGQRIGLLGRNGSGKTTFMRVLCGEVEADAGEIRMAPETRLALLPQDVPQHLTGPVAQIVAQGLPDQQNSSDSDPDQQWRHEHQIEQILSRMELNGEASFELLSSGMKRRVLLARALVADPDVLLLDEPTNHLDIDAIRWLEDFLNRWGGTLIFVTHDRMFLRRLATRILEIDRGRLFDWSCDYDTFLTRKEANLAAEEQQAALFDKKLALEEAWIRQGIKARRTRNEGRVRALEQLRRARSERRERVGTAKIAIQEAQRSGTLVAEVEHISFAYEGQPIVNDFSTTILRGDKIGIVGPNGAGKTTLLRLLLGQLTPQSGSVRLGTKLQIAYFDQLRRQLDEQKTVQENVGDGYESVMVGGKAKHILGYLQDFLFTPERSRTAVRFLSGGERNRILLAKLFAKPANVIVLDEPTNDLDTETLELLEERLIGFSGTVLVVSHDRSFLNQVVTSTIVFEDGSVNEYVGGYDDWLRQRSKLVATSQASRPTGSTLESPQTVSSPAQQSGPAAQAAITAAASSRRLRYKEQQELASLPLRIEQLEAAVNDLHERMAQPEFYKQPGEIIAQTQTQLKDIEAELAVAYARWEELEQHA